MKKATASLCVVFLINYSYADTTLYGSLRGAVEWFSTDRTITDTSTGQEVGSIKDSTLDVSDKNQVSRLGIKGDEELGNGLKAIYQVEFRVRADVGGLGDNDRHAYAGIESPYGKVAIGRQWSPYYLATDYNDIFRGSSSYLLYQQPFRLGDSVTYKTPEFFGLTLNSAVVFGTGAKENEVFVGLQDQDMIDIWTVAAEWDYKGLRLGAAYLDRADDTGKFASSAIGYQNDIFRLGFVFEVNVDGDTLFSKNANNETIISTEDAYHYNIAGEYYLTDVNTIRGGFAYLDRGDIGDAQQYVIGVEHKFSKRTLMWLEYTYTNSNEIGLMQEADLVINTDADDHLVSLGIRHDF